MSDTTRNINTQLDDRPSPVVRDENQNFDTEMTTTVDVLDYLCKVNDQIVIGADAALKRLAARTERIMLSPSAQHFGVSQPRNHEPDSIATTNYLEQYLEALNQQLARIDRILEYDADFFIADFQRILGDGDPDTVQWQLDETSKEIDGARAHLQATPDQLMQLWMSVDQIQTNNRLLARSKRALMRRIEQAQQSFLRISQFISKIDSLRNELATELQRYR